MSVSTRLYRPEDTRAFHDLNMEWIEAVFEVEDKDRVMLEDPQACILDSGGRIIIAEKDGETLGCVALMPVGPQRVELAKMAVSPAARGQGIGARLMARAEDEARDMGARTIWIESNTVLDAAMRLYRRSGFKELTAEARAPSPYQRCNIQFEKAI